MKTTATKEKTPWWGWVFVVICVSIPVVALGGAIPGAIGFGGAGLCYAIASNGKRSAPRRTLLCLIICISCWVAYGGLVYTVQSYTTPKVRRASSGSKTSATSTKPAIPDTKKSVKKIRPVPGEKAVTIDAVKTSLPRPVPGKDAATSDATKIKVISDEEKRKIYAKAASWQDRITDKQQKIAELKLEGKPTDFQEKQLKHIRGMYEKHIEFSTKWHKISRQELDSIINEGKKEGWLRE